MPAPIRIPMITAYDSSVPRSRRKPETPEAFSIFRLSFSISLPAFSPCSAVLCDSAVKVPQKHITAEAQRTAELRREEIKTLPGNHIAGCSPVHQLVRREFRIKYFLRALNAG